MTRFLVTGGTGFIGQHLVNRLQQIGEVRCLVRKPTKNIFNSDVEQIRGDILDNDCLHDAVKGMDIIFHAAGAIKGLSAKEFYDTNVIGCRNLAAAITKSSTSSTTVYISSMAAGGPATASSPRTESETPHPVSTYGRTKLGGEYEFRKYSDNIRVTVVRPAVVYGEGDLSSLELFKPISTGANYIVGSPEWKMSLINVHDLIELLLLSVDGESLASDQNSSQGIYQAAGIEAPRLDEFGYLIADALDVPRAKPRQIPKYITRCYGAFFSLISLVTRKPNLISIDKTRELLSGPWYISNEKAIRDLKFKQKVYLSDGLKAASNWYKEQGWI